MAKTIFKVNIVDQSVVFLTKPKLASGGVEENEIQFTFDSLWSGFANTAVFYKTDDEVYHIPISDNVATIPAEVTDEEGEFWFGVFGGNGEATRTTEVLLMEVAKGAITVSTAQPSNPTPDVYSQILKIANDAKAIAQGVRAEFESGVVPALRDQNSQRGFRIWTGTAEEYADQDPLPNGVMAVITDVGAEYILSKTDGITRYSGGTAEVLYRTTINDIHVNISSGGLFKSPTFRLDYPSYVARQPYFVTVSIAKTADNFPAMIQVIGEGTATQTPLISVVSDVQNDSASVTLEVRATFKWADE